MALIPRPFATWSTYKGHTGFDYPYRTGTPIRAGLAGKIIYAAWFNDRNGYMKAIDHGNGIVERYYHLESLQGPKVGDWVPLDGLIGYVGNTGTASEGPHLHHEVWYFGRNQPGMPYWNYIDDKRYVGDGSPSGGGQGEVDMPFDNEDKNYLNGMAQSIIDQLKAAIPPGVWAQAIQAQNAQGINQFDDKGKPITFPASGFVASTNGKVGTLSDVQVKAIADAVAAQIPGGITVDIDYDRIKSEVREEFRNNPLK